MEADDVDDVNNVYIHLAVSCKEALVLAPNLGAALIFKRSHAHLA